MLENKLEDNGDIAVVDVETTGFDAGYHEMIEIAVILCDKDFNIKDSFVSKIRPMHPGNATQQALDVNGLNLKDLRGEATPQQVRNAFLQWHEDVVEGRPLEPLAHNFIFDQRFLKVFFGRFYDEIFTYGYRDTKVTAKDFKKCGLLERGQSLKLVELCKHFNIPHSAHNAQGDALATLALYKQFMGTMQQLIKESKSE